MFSMAAAAQFPLAADASQKVPLSMQKKIFQDVLDCIVQLKADFFESHQPITDDSVVLQRFCAKFEHLIQVGMKDKVSLLGRKKDYWDYFSECLASAKGSNDGIKYVRSLGENKSSLGKGRAFIRFCLVHQRLADTLQQCIVHDKTHDWFIPGCLLMSQRECQALINSLYDLNSMHFDLSPRGFDLDAAWPSFANRKHGGSGSWNVPLSRRSSITSMDAISQISVSIDTSEVDRLTKDLESVQSMKSELIGQIGALQQEKDQVNQSAWTAQGEVQALDQQLSLLRSELASLQDKYKNLDADYVKLRLEKEQLEKAHREELSLLNERFLEEEAKRVNQLRSEEDIWKKEVKEEGERKKREINKLMKKLEQKSKEMESLHERWTQMNKALRTLFVDTKVRVDQEDLEASLVYLGQHVISLQEELESIKQQKANTETLLQEGHSEKDKQLALLEGRCLEMEKSMKSSKDAEVSLHGKVVALELELKGEREVVTKLEEQVCSLKEQLTVREGELSACQERKMEVEKTVKEFEDKVNKLGSEKDAMRLELDNITSSHVELSEELELKKSISVKMTDELNKSNNRIAQLTQSLDESMSLVQMLQNEAKNFQDLLTVKDEENLAMRESSNGKLLELESNIENNRKTLDEMTEKLVEREYELITAQKHVEESATENITLKENLTGVKSDLEKLTEESSQLRTKCKSLELQVEELTDNVRTKETIISEVKSECEKLQSDINQFTHRQFQLTAESKTIKEELAALMGEKEKCFTENLSLKADLENKIREMDVEKVKALKLLQESEGVRRSESDKDEKIFQLLVELEKSRSEKQESVKNLEEKITVLTSSITDKDQLFNTSVSELEALKRELLQEKTEKEELLQTKHSEVEILSSSKQESENKLRIVISQLQQEMEEIKRRHENEVSSFTERIKYLETQRDDKEQLLESRCAEYESKITEMRKEMLSLNASCQSSSENLSKLNVELAALTEERDHLLSQTDAALEDALQIKSQLTETSEQLAVSYTQLETITKEKNSLSESAAAMAEALLAVEIEKEELLREVGDIRVLLKAAEDESQEKLLQKRAVELQLEDLRTYYDQVVKEKTELASEVDNYRSQTQFSTKVLEESLVESRLALDQIKNEKLQLEEVVETLKRENTELSTTSGKVAEEKKKLQDRVEKLEQDLKQMDDSELVRLRQELNEERNNNEILSGEISALQFQLSAEQMLKTNHLLGRGVETENTEELKAHISELEVILEQLEEKCEALQSSKQVDSVQVHDVKKLLLSKQEECRRLEQQLEDLETRISQEMDRRERLEEDLTNLGFSYDRDIQERERKINILLSDNEQIKKQIIKLTKDKDNLWHKTDQLVTEQKRKVGEKWQDNAEVTHCPQCKAEFSLFTRKHHCRLCGRIYCYTCSDFWLDSPHSSKKVRVCKPCLDYHNHLGSSSLSSSLIDNESDDESGSEGGKLNFDQAVEGGSFQENLSDNGNIKTGVAVDIKSGDVVESGDTPDDDVFQIVSEEEVMKSISTYNQSTHCTSIPPDMTCSSLLFAEELESGEVNKQNEVWLKPGKKFAVPIDIEEEKTVLHWEFTSYPKDIVFSVNFRSGQSINITDAEEVVAPCKCDSHKHSVTGELTAKKSGIYTLVFDNTYSRLTSKKIHYKLEYKQK